MPRTLRGSLQSGWRLEALRIAQMKPSWLRSPLACSTFASFMVFVLLATYLPTLSAIKVIAFFALQSVVAFIPLEAVNYIEHYGLQRKAAHGKREPFSMMHAWNADHVVSNSMLANLQRHSDHHVHAWKRYPTLEPLPGPQLPTGYSGCSLLGMVPLMWHSLIHSKLDKLHVKMMIAP